MTPGGPRGIGGRRLDESTATFAPAGDVDGDGRGELLVGLTPADPLRGRGRVLVVRGATGPVVEAGLHPLLARIVGPEQHPGFGGSLATLPWTPMGTGDPSGSSAWLALVGIFIVLG